MDLEGELKREIEDLKERLAMGADEYKTKYIECKRLQVELKKIQKANKGSDSLTFYFKLVISDVTWDIAKRFHYLCLQVLYHHHSPWKNKWWKFRNRLLKHRRNQRLKAKLVLQQVCNLIFTYSTSYL